MKISFKKTSSLKDQEGAYLLEFLGALTGTLILIIMVVQLLLILLTAVLFNHAVQTASQEIAVQGGDSSQVERSFYAALPAPAAAVCPSPSPPPGSPPSPTSCPGRYDLKTTVPIARRLKQGQEKTVLGQLITVEGTYVVPTPLFGFLGPSNDTLVLRNQVKVASQSAKEN